MGEILKIVARIQFIDSFLQSNFMSKSSPAHITHLPNTLFSRQILDHGIYRET